MCHCQVEALGATEHFAIFHFPCLWDCGEASQDGASVAPNLQVTEEQSAPCRPLMDTQPEQEKTFL